MFLAYLYFFNLEDFSYWRFTIFWKDKFDLDKDIVGVGR